jgi:hypothetical protein
VRGQIIRELAAGEVSIAELAVRLRADERFSKALEGVIRDGLVARRGDWLHLTK